MTERQFDYPVQLGENHRAIDTDDYPRLGDRFECDTNEAYMHTGAWPTWGFCPFCGSGVDDD